MLLFDATHTSHSRARTGIQRVCRSLFAELERRGAAQAVCFDPYARSWRRLDAAELAALHDHSGPAGHSRGTHWPLHTRFTGHLRRLAGRRPVLPPHSGFLCPELFSPAVGASLPHLAGRIDGPRVALFHDAIGLKYPELTPPGTVARLPAYLRELLHFDGVAAVSEDSAACLRDYWQWLGVADTPPVVALPLGLDPVIAPAAAETTDESATRLLCVSTIEGRKNHLALLSAAERLWGEGHRFELELIGLPRPDTAAAALRKIRELQAAGHPLIFHGAVSDAALQEAYRRCTFTVYPSRLEGFGLPVLESLQHGRPCVCSGHGALGESARGGGCLLLESVEAPALHAALHRLLTEPHTLAALAAEARHRTFRTWRDCADDLLAWMARVPRR